MKARKRVGRGKKVARLRASADEREGRRDLPRDWAKFYRPIKKPVTLRLDADVIAWFQRQGQGYQTRINRALRNLMLQDRKKEGG